MFAPKVAKPPTKAAVASTNGAAPAHAAPTIRHPSIGNHAMLRLLIQTGERPPALETTPGIAPIQPRLAIGRVDDPLEHEADRITEQVTHITSPEVPLAPVQPSRQSATPERAQVPASVHVALRSTGRPLDVASRAYFEPRLGLDLNRVRLHTGLPAEQSARDLNAHAYTVGDDIVFAAGRLAPETPVGRQLLAHELTHVLQQTVSGTSPLRLQRQPVTGAKPALGEKGELPWSMYVPADQMPGDRVPGYENPRIKYDKTDVEVFWNQLHQREKDNKANVANFIGVYGEAITTLWGRHVSEVMANAGKSAGWSFFHKMLKFLAIKTIEMSAATLLTPAGVEIFEIIGKEVGEKVVEIGTEAVAGYLAEHRAEALEEHAKESEIDVAKEDIDKVTNMVAARLGKVTVSTIKSLPDITPYAKRLSEAERTGSYAQLASFRLPPLFPDIRRRDIYRIVAELLIVLLDEASASGGGSGTAGGHISVEGPGLSNAEIRVPSKDLRAAVAGKSIRDLPLMPLVIVIRSNNVDGIRPTADKLLRHFLFGAPAENDVEEFIKSSGEIDIPSPGTGYLLTVWRAPDGTVAVGGGSWSQRIYLYQWATSDLSLGKLAGEIRASSANTSPDVSGAVGETGVSRILGPADIATKMVAYLANNEPKIIKGARALITQHVEKLNPVAVFPGNE